jgi:anti-anti-sigma regulatory factor
MGIGVLSEQILLIRLPREPDIGGELETAADMANTASNRHVIVDFSQTSVLTSGMLSQLMILERRLNACDRKLILCSVPDGVAKVFRCVGLYGLFQFAHDQEAALKSLPGACCASP